MSAVLLYHAGASWMPGGFLGVSTFFTLSGFLITSLLLAEHAASGAIALAAFWERRFRRILPASFLALGLVVAFGAWFADDHQRSHLRGDVLATMGYVVNWWFIFTRRDYAEMFGSPSPVQHFWSLAIEEQFYLLFPLLAWWILRRCKGSANALGLVLGALAAASVAWMFVLIPTDAPAARLYYGTDTRAAELLGGALLAIWLDARRRAGSRDRSRLRTALGATGLAASALFWVSVGQHSPGLYAGGLAAYTAASMAIVSAAVLPAGPVRALLSLRPLRALGRVSYGLYLYHFPIFLGLTPELTGLAGPALFAVRVGASLALAWLSLRCIEMPIREGRLLSGWHRFAAPPVALAMVAAALMVVTADAPPPVRAAASVTPSAGAGTTAAPPRRWWEPASLRVLVIGDSMAADIGQALGRWTSSHPGMAVIVEAKRGCGLARGNTQADRDQRIAAAPCAAWFVSLPATVDRLDPDVVVAYSANWDLVERRLPHWESAKGIGDREFDEWLVQEYRWVTGKLTARGAQVMWLSSLCMKARAMDPQGAFDPDKVIRLNRLLVDLLQQVPDKATYVDLHSQVCPAGKFSDTIQGIEKSRPDGVHFSVPAADWVAGWLAPQLRSVRSR